MILSGSLDGLLQLETLLSGIEPSTHESSNRRSATWHKASVRFTKGLKGCDRYNSKRDDQKSFVLPPALKAGARDRTSLGLNAKALSWTFAI